MNISKMKGALNKINIQNNIDKHIKSLKYIDQNQIDKWSYYHWLSCWKVENKQHKSYDWGQSQS